MQRRDSDSNQSPKLEPLARTKQNECEEYGLFYNLSWYFQCEIHVVCFERLNFWE